MFTQPINQSGLSGFIPVRRQEGGVPNQELDIGQIPDKKLNFNIFGQRISGGPIDQTTTNIGQIENPQQLAPGIPQGISSLIPVDGGADDPFEGAPDISLDTVSPPDISFDTVKEGVVDVVDDISGRVMGAFQGKEGFLDSPVVASVLNQTVQTGLQTAFNIGKLGLPATALVGNLIEQKVLGKPIDYTELALETALGLITALNPIFAIPIALYKLVKFLFFSEEEETVEGLGGSPGGVGSAPGSGIDAAMGGLGIGIEGQPGITGKGFDDFSDFGTVPSVGPSSGVSPGSPGYGGYSNTGAMGGPSAPDGPGDGDADADGDAGAPGCWVAGTKILMADSTYCNIEDLEIGDMVMSFPETKKTRRWNTPLEPQPIISLLVDVHPEIWHLNNSMVSGTEWIIKGDGTAAIVQWLNIGDTVLGPDNNLIKVTRVEPAEGDLKKQIIYNFETKFNYSYTANNMRTIRGRAVRASERGPWSEEYLAGDTNAYEGSMQDEYDKKFKTYTS